MKIAVLNTWESCQENIHGGTHGNKIAKLKPINIPTEYSTTGVFLGIL